MSEPIADSVAGEMLRTITDDDIKELGICMLGHVKRIRKALEELRTRESAAVDKSASGFQPHTRTNVHSMPSGRSSRSLSVISLPHRTSLSPKRSPVESRADSRRPRYA